MDQTELKQKLHQFFSKYKYVMLVLLLGIGLMMVPTTSERPEAVSPITADVATNLSEDLELILSQMEGVGRSRVLLTEGSREETIYQTDEDRTQDGSVRVDTVVISTSDRGQQGLVRTVTPPTYLGAIVVCQGGNRPSVRLAVIEAVSNVTGISTDRISVLKMK